MKSPKSTTKKLETSNIPYGWDLKTLEECVDILDNKRTPINKIERKKRIGNIPYYGTTGQVGWIDDFLFDEELVLLGEDAAPFLEPLKNKAYIINGKSWVNNHAHVLRAKKDITTNLYILHYLNYFDYLGFVTGTTRLKLNQTLMKKIPIFLPSLPQQIEISNKIDELFSDLANSENKIKSVISNAIKYKRSILQFALYGNLTKKWRDTNKISEPSETLKKIIGIKQGEKNYNPEKSGFTLPRLVSGWKWTTIGNISNSMKNGIYKSKSYYSEEGTICLRMYNIENGKIVWKNLKKMKLTPEEIKEFELTPGDILVNRVNSKELVGKSAPILEGYKQCVFESKNIRLRLIPELTNFQFVSYWFELFGRGYFNKNAQQTVGMASINQEQLSFMPIVFPSLEEQNEIVKKLKGHFEKINLLIESTKNFQEGIKLLRYSILKSAFNAKLIN